MEYYTKGITAASGDWFAEFIISGTTVSEFVPVACWANTFGLDPEGRPVGKEITEGLLPFEGEKALLTVAEYAIDQHVTFRRYVRKDNGS